MKKHRLFQNFILISVLLSLFILTSCSTGTIPPPPTPSPVQIIDIPANYDHEFTKEIMGYGVRNEINIWDKDPAVWIGTNASQDYINEAKEAIGKLAQFTDYVIIPYVVDNKALADITFEWVDELADLPIGGVANVFLTEINNKGVIKKAKIFCWNKVLYGALGGTCLEELTQALGPMFDRETYPESVLSASTKKYYCPQDLAAGKVIYQLEPGTTFAEFDKIIEESLKTYSIVANK